MKTQITNSHLKTHNMTTKEYKLLYGEDSLTCPEYRAKLSANRSGKNNPNYGNKWSEENKLILSEKLKGKTPWNKNKKINVTEKMKQAIENRERKYETGELERVKVSHSEQTKEKISKSVKEYAINNKDELKKRAKKAVETKQKNKYDFGKVMRGKTHTPEAKQKISETSKKTNAIKSEISLKKLTKNALLANCELIEIKNNIATLKCLKCENKFSYTKQYLDDCRITEKLCPFCFPRNQNKTSVGENELFTFIKTLAPDSIQNYKLLLDNKKEIDIFIPSHQMAIEFNGLYWHSENLLESIGQNKFKDNIKRKELNQKGIRYIGIFEDEWKNKQEIVKSRLENILGKTQNKIYARKCVIKEISSKEASKFCRDNHIQGVGRSNVRYGLFYNDILVSVMTFSKNNISRKIRQWELNRFCNKIGYTVIGGGSKLLKKFINDYSPEFIISYSDNRWSEGKLYQKLGFEFMSETPPNYWYFRQNELERKHRFSLRKNKNDDQSKTEKQLRTEEGYLRIWDCGSTKWIWKRAD
jgi:hypothetical protein